MWRVRHLLILLVISSFSPKVSCGWSPCVQGVISLAAVENLSDEEQVEFFNLLRHHPQYEEMVAPPESTNPAQEKELIITRAGTWADRIAGTKYDRPNWHFYPGLWKKSRHPVLHLPRFELPDNAAAKPHDLNLLQALKLCRNTFANKSLPDSERAIAMCWLMSLIAKQNQPLRLYSLQINPLFADGDDHGRGVLIGGRTILDLVENYSRCGDDIGGTLTLKEKLEHSDRWRKPFMRMLNSPGLTADEHQLAIVEIDLHTIYMPVEFAVTLAILRGDSSPLELPERKSDKHHFQWIEEAYMPKWTGRAAGQLSTVLAESL